MLTVWERHCAWNGLAELNTDVLLGVPQTDEDKILADIADFLWQSRHLAQQPKEN